MRNLTAIRISLVVTTLVAVSLHICAPLHAQKEKPEPLTPTEQDQIAEAGESGEGLAMASAGEGEAGDLGDTAGDERSGGVVAEVEAVHDSGGHRDYVL